MRLRHLRVVVPALMLVVACGRHRDTDADEKDVPVGLSRGAASADGPLGAGDIRIVSADSGVDLAMIGDTISGGLSALTLAKVRHDTDTGAVTGSGFGPSLERMIKGTVQSAISTRVTIPLSSVREVRYEGGKLVFEWNGKPRKVFGTVREGNKDFLEAFRPEDAQRFVAAVRARKQARGGG